MRLISNIKQKVMPAGRHPRTILSGPFKNIKMELELQNQSQIFLGLFEKETHRWVKALSAGIASGVDIGAAYGEYCLYFLMRTDATVYAFEPELESIESLHSNLRLNGLAGTDRLVVSNSFLGSVNEGRTTRLDSIAEIVKEPCFVKMDVDGAEAEILSGATQFNRLKRVRWLVETHSKQLEIDCDRALQDAGFKTKIIPNAWWRAVVPETRHVEQNRWIAAWKPADLPNL